MKHLSLIKIIVALCICNIYIFTCGVVGVVGKSDKSEPLADDSSESVPGETAESDEHGGFGTVDFIVPDAVQTEAVYIEALSFASPPLAERPVQSSFVSSENEPSEAEVTSSEAEADDTAIDNEGFVIVDTYEPEETTAQKPQTTTPPDVTAPPSTTAPPATTTTAAPPAATTTAATTLPTGGIPVDDESIPVDPGEDLPDITKPADGISDSGAADEILYVTSGGVTVSGTAVDIVARVTQNEMGYTFAPEAIKAQAVAAYTYIKYCNKYGTYPSVALSDNVNDSVRVLTESVIGQAIYYDGSYIQAVYSASSAGYTASSENVWGNAYPYLTSVYCELDSQYDPNYGRTATFSSEDMKSRVYSATGISLSGDPSTWFTIDSRVDGNYVGQLNVGGYHSYTNSSGSTVKITGRVFRESIMDYDIRSSAFDISYDASTDLFTITTYGYGHGVGMSQNGANNLATYWGWDYKQILEFYYTGAKVQ